MALKEEILHLIRTDPEVRDAVRREVLTEELLAVPERLRILTDRVDALALAQQRTEERLDALTHRVDLLTVQVTRMAAALEQALPDLHRLSEWQRGEQRRRDGERFERDTIRRATSVFGGGRAAMERPDDADRIRKALQMTAEMLPEQDDPFLADLLWLKGERVAVVEISRQVDQWDIELARRRAATLRDGGLDVMPVVIGRDWASDAGEFLAQERAVEWRVAESGSAGYLEFRRSAGS